MTAVPPLCWKQKIDSLFMVSIFLSRSVRNTDDMRSQGGGVVIIDQT